MDLTFDFIIVGGGPSGSALAKGLANSTKKPSVLLLEAGGTNDDHKLRVDGQRWLTFLNQNMNWGYKTSPQEHCNNRELDYSRGKGLGGSSAINFGVYSIGARDDYDEWARIVGDDSFNWERTQRRFKNLETFNGKLPEGINSKFAAPRSEDHGSSGKLQVGYATEWEEDLVPMLDLFQEAGFPLNPDHNSGNPIGMSVLINSSHKGRRSTARDLLMPFPDNLTVITASPVQRVILKGCKAVGVESNGKIYLASNEVILSAGSLDSPKILMHSGIGPRGQLENFGISVIKDMPAIGQGLRDHMFCPLVFKRKDSDTSRALFYGNQHAMDDALEQWKQDGSGPWTKFACELGIGWFKLDKLVASEEFEALSPDEQTYLNKETIPHYEILTHFPVHWFIPQFPQDSLSYSCLLVFYYNAQSRGEVTLQSANPDVPLKFDPKFLSSPFDRRAAIESLRDALRLTKHDSYAKDNIATIAGPEDESDEGTVKMGKPQDADAVVDNKFRVMGMKNLRVADMSVVPVLASCHVQSVAYVTGMICAEMIIEEYGLSNI
ncbi:hypothetical protein TARUN_7326 [Trichoderma arundinaceum]|uniref:Glucose-methanol-choline oxidoreductase N-terminal domain-containing protein n=1 Tax=Trichoderma arundinaceum TaxID=490622 RepID=A0A395NFL1_TRIAR|nr:hypothetical protein TARUN_7326 [Trichoderma arundinaceum]